MYVIGIPVAKSAHSSISTVKVFLQLLQQQKRFPGSHFHDCCYFSNSDVMCQVTKTAILDHCVVGHSLIVFAAH